MSRRGSVAIAGGPPGAGAMLSAMRMPALSRTTNESTALSDPAHAARTAVVSSRWKRRTFMMTSRTGSEHAATERHVRVGVHLREVAPRDLRSRPVGHGSGTWKSVSSNTYAIMLASGEKAIGPPAEMPVAAAAMRSSPEARSTTWSTDWPLAHVPGVPPARQVCVQ